MCLHVLCPLGHGNHFIEAVGPVLDSANDGILNLLGVVSELCFCLEASLLEEGLDLLLVANLHILELVAFGLEEAHDAVNIDVDAFERVTEHLTEVRLVKVA